MCHNSQKDGTKDMHKTTIGIILAGIAGLSWGSMAVAAQYLLDHFSFTPTDLVCGRLFGAGLIILLFELLRGVNVFNVGGVRNWIDLAIYGLALLSTQYSFFEAIKYTNAGTAAVVVAVAPALILFYMRVVEHYAMSVSEVASVVLCFLGVALLGTKGEIETLDFSLIGLVWALTSAATGVFGTLFCRHLLNRVGVLKSVGWASVISGAVMCMIYSPWSAVVVWEPISIACYFYVVVIGTVVAFCCYLGSMRYITANVASILSCLEPISGLFLSVAILGVTYGVAESVGAAMILGAVTWLSIAKRN